MHSKLTSEVCIAHSGNYKKGRSGYKVCKITPHQMAGKLTGKQCAKNIFGVKGRLASANYCIGYNGDIVCNVEEEDRAYTSSSAWNDNQAITIEVSNSANGTDKITEASWNALVELCVDICSRYNFRLNYTGDKNGSLTRHNMYANTSCPGAYLQSRFPELVQVVNARLDGAGPTPQPTPQPTQSQGEYLVKVTTDVLNIREGAGTNYKVVGVIKDKGTYTIVETTNNWGKLKSGTGWICLDYTDKKTTNTPKRKSNEEIADEVIKGLWGTGKDRKNRLTKEGYDYNTIQAIVNKKLS